MLDPWVCGTERKRADMVYVRKAAGMAIIILAGVVAWLLLRPDREPNHMEQTVDSTALAEVTVPESLSARARAGERIFRENCVTCHGINAAGKDGVGPPLVHILYEPSHHGDEAIQRGGGGRCQESPLVLRRHGAD